MTRALFYTAILTSIILGSGCRTPIEAADDRPAATHTDESKRGAAERIERFALGRAPTADEIDAWNIDIMPDGEGLPCGSGSVREGRALYLAQCQRCHGVDGRGGPFDQLAGGLGDESDAGHSPIAEIPFALEPGRPHTIGNYWPFATTIFDYTRRSMPMDRPGSLSDDEVYALTAYLLYLNGLVEESALLDQKTLPEVVMPARDRFVPDDRRGGAEIR